MALTTTTIGAYPKPDYVQIPDWFRAPAGPDRALGPLRAEQVDDDATGIPTGRQQARLDDHPRPRRS